MKICPFCKTRIQSFEDVCPFCNRTLVEKVWAFPQKVKSTTGSSSSTYHEAYVAPTIRTRSSYKKYIPLLLLWIVILLILWSRNTQEEIPISIVPNTIDHLPIDASSPARPIASLPDGTILSLNKNYLQWWGELLIENWTNSDHVIKLVHNYIDKSIYTVYIKANSEYTIKNISNWVYKLLFHSWEDWNETVKWFNKNGTPQMFEDFFRYETTQEHSNDYVRDINTSWSITLHPVASWDAQTDFVSIDEFARY